MQSILDDVIQQLDIKGNSYSSVLIHFNVNRVRKRLKWKVLTCLSSHCRDFEEESPCDWMDEAEKIFL